MVPVAFLVFKLRTPLLASVRSELLWLLPLGLTGWLLLSLWELRQQRQRANHLRKLIQWFLVVLCAAGLALVLTTEGRYQATKRTVLTGDRTQLEQLGQHLVVGYRNFDEVQTLVQKGGIGGIFITRRNLQGKTAEQLHQEIMTLQAIRHEQQLPPLWVATDQEGGVVSRLSPPLTYLPPLAEVVNQAENSTLRHQQVHQYGDTHGQELADLGVNLNFAPVVDLNKGIVTPGDKFSVIYQRAISEDNAVVAMVAQDYCAALSRHGVRCTLKHFPGLGRLQGDTHLTSAYLNTSLSELAQDDWLPFHQLMATSDAMTMLGHPILTAVDDQNPVSFSEQVIHGILRQQWHHEGLLITDDFSMGAVFNSRDGIQRAVVKALNAGGDLILISYDTDLYYPVMAALMQADRQGMLSRQRLAESRDRLQQNPPYAPT
ncbi:MAG: glycoside hydrolase family 3 protein [Leptolyngbya sp. SIO1D8]|nr:glycoside hydrolase family 3 protein [Leptolyngbya sp. SIO1D8]